MSEIGLNLWGLAIRGLKINHVVYLLKIEQATSVSSVLKGDKPVHW